MEQYGRKLGADPDQWFAMADAVPVSATHFEILVDKQWVTYGSYQNEVHP